VPSGAYVDQLGNVIDIRPGIAPGYRRLTRAEIIGLEDLHDEAEQGGSCVGCGEGWPCRTERLIAEVQALRAVIGYGQRYSGA
jgi:hypothetical protein